MIYLVAIFFLIQLLVAIVLWIGKQKIKSIHYLSDFENTSIVIPFKNEKDRILPLIKSINQSAIKHKYSELFKHLDFIFVDDHSNDDTYKILLDQLDVKFRYFKLRTTSGKKYAIKHGVEQAKFNKILTLDADISFDVDYLNNLSKTPCKGLSILPVKMEGKSILQKLFSVEFEFLQHLTFGMAGYNSPFLCNGANLLFTKQAFKQSLNIRKDADIQSGDDIFLLEAIQQLNFPISAFYCSELTIKTNSPQSIKELLNQRKRWFKKMKGAMSYLGALFILMSNVLFVFSVYQCFYNPLYLYFIGIKILSETISVDGFKNKILVILHQFYYPIYLLIMLLALPKKSKWK